MRPHRQPELSARSLFQLADGLSGALLGLVFYGSWAVFANFSHGLDVAVQAGLLQGALSFIVTLSGTTLMKQLYGQVGRPWLRALRAAIGALALIYLIIISAHWLNETPEILLTLAPGLPITIAFCLSFCWGLMRYGQPQATPELSA